MNETIENVMNNNAVENGISTDLVNTEESYIPSDDSEWVELKPVDSQTNMSPVVAGLIGAGVTVAIGAAIKFGINALRKRKLHKMAQEEEKKAQSEEVSVEE